MRFAHISDLHFISFKGSRITDYLNKRWVGGLNILVRRRREHPRYILEALFKDLLANDYDHVLVTGDMSSLALNGEFEAARDALRQLGGAERVTIIPGNHDIYVPAVARPRVFDEFFREFFPDPGRAGTHDHYPYGKVVGPVAIIGVNTAVPAPWYGAWGKVSRAQLERLDALLKQTHIASRFRIVMIHHYLRPRKVGDPGRIISGRRALINTFKRNRVDMVLHGHEHAPMAYKIKNKPTPIPVYDCGASARHGKQPNECGQYHIYTIAEDTSKSMSLQSVQARRYNPLSNTYEPVEPPQIKS